MIPVISNEPLFLDEIEEFRSCNKIIPKNVIDRISASLVTNTSVQKYLHRCNHSLLYFELTDIDAEENNNKGKPLVIKRKIRIMIRMRKRRNENNMSELLRNNRAIASIGIALSLLSTVSSMMPVMAQQPTITPAGEGIG